MEELNLEPLDHKFLKELLNDQEIAELERLNESPAAQSAIKKIFLSQIYYRGILKKGEMPDPNKNFLFIIANQNPGAQHERLGADLAARTYALQLVEEGYKELLAFKRFVIPTKEDKNPAR